MMIISCSFCVNRTVIDNRGCAKCSFICRLLRARNETGHRSQTRPWGGLRALQCQIIRLYTVSRYIRSQRSARHYAHNSCVADWTGRYELTTVCLCVVDDALSLNPRLDAAQRCNVMTSCRQFTARPHVCFSFRSFRLAPLVDPTQRLLCGRSTSKTSAANNKTLYEHRKLSLSSILDAGQCRQSI